MFQALIRIDNQHESSSLSSVGNLAEVFRLYSGLVTSFVLAVLIGKRKNLGRGHHHSFDLDEFSIPPHQRART